MNNIPSNELNDKFNAYEKQSFNFIIEEAAATTVTNVKFSNDNIEAAIQWQNDANIRMVYPCEDIDAAYYAYLDQPISLRFDADNKCTELFGMNCEELYKFLKNCDATATFIDREDDYSLSTKLDNTFDGISYSLESAYDDYSRNKIRKELSKRHENNNKVTWEFAYSPMMTPEEINDNHFYYSDEKNDIVDNLSNEYSKAYYGLDNNFDCVAWDDTLRKLFYLKDISTDDNTINKYNQHICDMGWNPQIPYNDENRKKAYERICKAQNDRYSCSDIIDNTGYYKRFDESSYIQEAMKSGYYPIHIILVKGTAVFSKVISKVTGGPFSHSAICIDNDFKRLYSFNMKTNNKLLSNKDGFSMESIKEYPQNTQMGVYTIFVTEDQYLKISDKIQQYVDHQGKTRYSIANLITILFKDINLNMDAKKICSQFVDGLLKLANIDITGMMPDKVNPNTFYKMSLTNNKIYKIYEGAVKDFNYKKAEKLVERMSFRAKLINEANLQKATDTYEVPILTEARNIFKIKDNGDVLLSKPIMLIDLDEEYANTHRLLLNYDKTNNYDGMKYELCRLFYMNYILEKRLSKNNKHKSKDIKTRARVLNDFNKYLTILLKNQPRFNFSEYYEASPFYHNSIEIDKNTVKYTTDLLRSMLLI